MKKVFNKDRNYYCNEGYAENACPLYGHGSVLL